MEHLVWTQQAMDDLRAIHDLIARDTEAYAELLAEELFEKATELADNPEAGSPVAGIEQEGLREINCGGFRLIYRHHEQQVQILAGCPGYRPAPDQA